LLGALIPDATMPIAYSASTVGATFLLDEAGVCRRVVLKREAGNQQTVGGRSRSQAARRVVGAQYVASIDTRVEGGLVPMPRCGAAMLFAYADDDGRLAVVRTAPLVRFETMAQPDDTVPVPELDDECLTIPLTNAIIKSLASSGERETPRWLLDEGPDVTVPADLPPTWPKLPPEREVRLRKVSVVDMGQAREERRPGGKGMLPKLHSPQPPSSRSRRGVR
jgi:hypothetical protein